MDSQKPIFTKNLVKEEESQTCVKLITDTLGTTSIFRIKNEMLVNWLDREIC